MQDVIIGDAIQKVMEKHRLTEPPASVIAYAAAVYERIYGPEQQGGTA